MTGAAALAGVRILDMTRLLPGNFATLLLAGLGADVIKIEEVRGGDGIRYMVVPPGKTESSGHALLNRGKRSAAIDLKTPEGVEVMRELVRGADVLIDSFRPGVLDRLGLDAASLLAANPSLVHVSINAFGATGPYTAVPAHDLNCAGYAGALSLVAGSDGTPPMPAIQNADMASGMQAALAVLAGLRVAERDGEPYRADVAMTDSAAALLAIAAATAAGTAQAPPVPDVLTGALACYRLYECSDGRWLTVGGLEPKFFGRMTELMGLPELAARQYEPAGQDEVAALLAAEFAKRTLPQWMDLLAQEDTCVGPVLTITEALAEPHFAARSAVTEVQFRDGSTAPVFRAVPWDGRTADVRLTAPEHGEHTAAVLAEAGIGSEAIASLLAERIVGPSS